MCKILLTSILLSVICLADHQATANSLWPGQEGNTVSLFTDHKASQVGDIITVMIVENASMSQKADSQRNRKSNITGEVKNWAFPMFYHGMRTEKARTGTLPEWEIDTSNKHSGSGTFTGNYNLKGQITTRVVEVLPNSNLFIEGTSEVLINNQRNTIAISGIVRGEDVNAQNTVLSTQLADAKVRMVGNGPLTDKTKRGFMELMMDYLWPF